MLAAVISAGAALALAAVSYYLTKRHDREAEWRKLKLEYYREFVAAMPGVVGAHATPSAHSRLAYAQNNLNLVAPKEVIEKLYAFWEEIRNNKELDKARHDALFSALIRAIRHDIQPGRSGINEALRFRLMNTSPE